MTESQSLDAMYVDSFNRDLAILGSLARVALPTALGQQDQFRVIDADGECVGTMPMSATPEFVTCAYCLFETGFRAGEESAWSRLRRLIGAAPAIPSRR